MKKDYASLIESLRECPTQGVDLGNGVRKVRMAITSKGKGKSGGARVITFLVVGDEVELVLLTIYDKSEMENISQAEINALLKNVACKQK